jgi:hypothetical protein
MQWTHYDYTNKNSKGQERFKKKSNSVSMGIYFFMVVMLTCAILVVLR